MLQVLGVQSQHDIFWGLSKHADWLGDWRHRQLWYCGFSTVLRTGMELLPMHREGIILLLWREKGDSKVFKGKVKF